MLHQSRISFIFVRSFCQFPCYFGSLYILKLCFVWVCWLIVARSLHLTLSRSQMEIICYSILWEFIEFVYFKKVLYIVFPHRNVIMLKSSALFYMYGSNYSGTICEHPLFALSQLSNQMNTRNSSHCVLGGLVN